ncbi:MAG: cyclase family protein, partial [Acidobacteria bacterium]|nr:cyclase family protein [Acidobacteriota bacterium]
MARVPKLLDVSVPLKQGLPTFPNNPSFELQPLKRMAEGASSNVSRLVMGTHTGTHVDAPRHFIDGGAGVDGLALNLLIGR